MLLTKLPVAVGLAGVALAANAVTYTPGTYTEKATVIMLPSPSR